MHLAEGSEPGRHLLRLADDRSGDHLRRLLGGDRREHVVHPGRGDHRRPHQRHVDRRDVDSVVDHLGGDHPAERVERRLRGDVGGEARRVGLGADRADVDDVARLVGPHRGQQREDQPHRAEVVDLHRPLVVVEAVVGEADRAADRAAGVVDEDVDPAVVGEDLVGHPLDVLGVGHVAAVDVGDPAGGLDLLPWSPRACPSSGRRAAPCAPASATLTAVALPIPEEAPVISTTLPRTAADERAVLEEVGVEVALPVVPELVGVGLQRRHLDPRARRAPPAALVESKWVG